MTQAPPPSSPLVSEVDKLYIERLCKAAYFHAGRLRIKDILSIASKANICLPAADTKAYQATRDAIKVWQVTWPATIFDAEWLFAFVNDQISSFERKWTPPGTPYQPSDKGPYNSLSAEQSIKFWALQTRWNKAIFLKLFDCLGDAIDLDGIWEDAIWKHHALTLYATAASTIWSFHVLKGAEAPVVLEQVELICSNTFLNLYEEWPYAERRPDGVPLVKAAGIGIAARQAVIRTILERKEADAYTIEDGQGQ